MSNSSASKPPLIVRIGLLALGLAVVAIALLIQRGQPDQRLPVTSLEAADDVSDEQLTKFALIFDEVADILAVLEYQRMEARDQRAVEQAEQKAEDQMIAIVRRHGMKFGEYHQIARLLREDTELFERFQRIQQRVDRGTDRRK